MEKPKRNIERARQLAQGGTPEAKAAAPKAELPGSGKKRKAVPFRQPARKKQPEPKGRATRNPPPKPRKDDAPPSTVELRIRELRAKRSRRKRRWIAAVVVALLAALAWATGLYGASLSLAEDIAEGFQVSMDQSGGWPARTAISQPLQAEELTGGFVLLGKEDLAVYSGSGAKLRSIQHGYGRPVITTGSNRFCLYNRAGTSLRVESRTKTVYTKTTEDPIILCQLARNGNLTVITQAQRYAANLVVYNRDMLPIYQWKVADDNGTPARVAFSDNNRWLAVGSLGARNGKLCTVLHFANIYTEQEPVSCFVEGSTLLGLQWLSGSTVLAVFDNMAATYSTAGQQLACYDYAGNALQDYDIQNRELALLFTGPADSRVVVLSSGMAVRQDFTAEPAGQILYANGQASLMRGESVALYDSKGTETARQTFEATPRAMLKARHQLVFTDGQAMLLNY